MFHTDFNRKEKLPTIISLSNYVDEVLNPFGCFHMDINLSIILSLSSLSDKPFECFIQTSTEKKNFLLLLVYLVWQTKSSF